MEGEVHKESERESGGYGGGRTLRVNKILSPAHKRFISLSPLITLSNPAVPTCVFVHVCVYYIYI